MLASGKNIYPEEVEAQYLKSPFIKEICVMGVALPDEPAAERLHAIVVPDLDVMQERRIVNFREILRFDIEGLSIDLPHHKRVLSFDVWLEDLPRTTTRKLKRFEIERRYRDRAALRRAARRSRRVERGGRDLGGRSARVSGAGPRSGPWRSTGRPSCRTPTSNSTSAWTRWSGWSCWRASSMTCGVDVPEARCAADLHRP